MEKIVYNRRGFPKDSRLINYLHDCFMQRHSADL